MDSNQPSPNIVVGALASPAFIVNAAGELLSANAAAVGLLGRTDQAVMEALIPASLRDDARVHGVAHREASLPDRSGALVLQVIALRGQDSQVVRFLALIAEETDVSQGGQELQEVRTRLREVQQQLMHSERMASIGQLAAGVAHEINNPIGYVHSNLGSLQEYLNNLFGLIELYQGVVYGSAAVSPERRAEIDQHKRSIDYEFLLHDLPQLLSESREGIDRVRRIVQDLRDFSRVDRVEAWSLYDLHRGLDSTLGIVWNEIKYKARLHKEYGNLPLVECLPSQINQVFMNVLVNAAQALGDNGEIRVSTGRDEDTVWVEISDTGTGIAAENLPRIFDPFFSTKAVGEGTGLGLSISYGIVKKHHGDIQVQSKPGNTVFRIVLPQRHAPQPQP
jgi:two-component system NtrC family sensor kinase